MSQTTDAGPARPKKPTPRRLRVLTLLIIVAGCAFALAAWRFSGENADAGRAWTSLQLRGLKDSDPARRRAAVEALDPFGERDFRRVVDALIAALRDPDPGIRRASAGSLARAIGRGAKMLKGAVDSEVHEASLALLRALAKDPDAEVRAEAARALAAIEFRGRPNRASFPVGPDPAVAVPALLDAMGDGPDAVRTEAILALGVIAPRDGVAPPALLDALATDPNPRVRAAAARALARLDAGGGLGWADADAVFAGLVRGLSDQDQEVRDACGWFLAGGGTPPEGTLPDLIRALEFEGPDRWPREPVADALGRLGPAAREALPALLDLARREHRQRDFYPTASRAIFRIDPGSPEARSLVGLLIELGDNPNRTMLTQEASRLLADLGPAARSVVPELREALESPNLDFRSAAEYALRSIGEAPGP